MESKRLEEALSLADQDGECAEECDNKFDHDAMRTLAKAYSTLLLERDELLAQAERVCGWLKHRGEINAIKDFFSDTPTQSLAAHDAAIWEEAAELTPAYNHLKEKFKDRAAEARRSAKL